MLINTKYYTNVCLPYDKKSTHLRNFGAEELDHSEDVCNWIKNFAQAKFVLSVKDSCIYFKVGVIYSYWYEFCYKCNSVRNKHCKVF